jgi:hypothetical protein
MVCTSSPLALTPRITGVGRITHGAPKPFAERVEDLIGQSVFSLVWPDEMEITHGEKSGKIFSQKYPIKNGCDPLSPKVSCHKRSTRSANGSGEPYVILRAPECQPSQAYNSGATVETGRAGRRGANLSLVVLIGYQRWT